MSSDHDVFLQWQWRLCDSKDLLEALLGRD